MDNKRMDYLDNLRSLMVFFVVLLHCGGVYESTGIWGMFWLVDDPVVNNLSGALNLVLDSFVMSVIFFISGYLTVYSCDSKKGSNFLKNKFKRLMIPWLIGVFTLMPLYKFIFLYSRGLPQQEWTSYFHFSNGIFSQSWLWFLPVLFIFNIIYMIISKLNIETDKVKLKKAVLFIFVIGSLYSWSLAMFDLRGWTKTFIIDFQNERLLIYLMIFILGSLSNKNKYLEKRGNSLKFYIFVNSTLWIPVNAYIFLLLLPYIVPDYVLISKSVHSLLTWMSFNISLLGFLYSLLVTFERWCNKQGTFLREINQNTYGVYIIHVVVLGVIGTALLRFQISSILKYVILVFLTYIASNLLVYLYRLIKKRV